MVDYKVMQQFLSQYPSTDILRSKAKKRMPRFAFEYLDGGCNENININKNVSEIQKIELMPQYLKEFESAEISVTLFGKKYSAPFGIAPVGLQGLIWPDSAEILAASAYKHNIPFILSTVTTSSIERISEITKGNAWFQLYYPAKEEVLLDIIERLKKSQYQVLVLLADVPTFGFRPTDIMNGLSMPPKMSMRNFMQIMVKPKWAFQMLKYGQPNFETLKPYMNRKLSIKQLGKFMDQTFSGRLTEKKISKIRDLWPGKLVVKGIVNKEDMDKAISLGVDGVIVSNHGGRQLDAGQSTIAALKELAPEYKDKITLMIDSGLRSGPDVARVLASGGSFAFMGRPFMYGVGALGRKGGDHTISMLKIQFQQIMDQLCCENVQQLDSYLISKENTVKMKN